MKALAAALVALAILGWLYFPESIDDAYITLRFARNLLRGEGPVFDPGERVEGYSNFLWMALLALLGKLGAPMPVAMKALGLASGLATLVIVHRAAAEWFRSRAAVATAVLLLGSSAFFALWSVDGLETVFHAMLLTALALAASRDEPSTLRVGLLGAAVSLTRPEGVLFALVAAALVTKKGGLRRGAAAVLPFAIAFGGYAIFRWLWFGALSSNVALAKLHPGVDTAASGLLYLLAFNAASGWLVLPAALAGALAARRFRPIEAPFLFALAQGAFLLLSGGDFMFGYRFVVPVMPCLALLAAAGIEALERRIGLATARAAAAVLVLVQAVAQLAAVPPMHVGLDNLTRRAGAHFDVGAFLAARTGAEDLVAASEVGVLGWSVEARIVDYLGLVSPFRRVTPDRDSVDVRYVLAGEPRFVVLSFVERDGGEIDPRLPMDADVHGDAEFRAGYEPLRSFDLDEDRSLLEAIYYRHAPGAVRVFFTVFERRR